MQFYSSPLSSILFIHQSILFHSTPSKTFNFRGVVEELMDVEIEIDEFPPVLRGISQRLPFGLQVIAFGVDVVGSEVFVCHQLGPVGQSRVHLGLVAENLLLQHAVLLVHALRLEQIFADSLCDIVCFNVCGIVLHCVF